MEPMTVMGSAKMICETRATMAATVRPEGVTGKYSPGLGLGLGIGIGLGLVRVRVRVKVRI